MGILKFNQKSAADLDSPEALENERLLLSKKIFLKKLYKDFYREIFLRLSSDQKIVVEIGSGGGIIKEVIPSAITSDVRCGTGIDMIFNACEIPFPDESIDALLMVNVFHHLQDVEGCLRSFSRVLRPGGKIIMIEPANTPWRRWTDRRFHHEIFDPSASWDIGPGGPLSAANGALPWIVFIRDRNVFEKKFPQLRVCYVREHTPFRYFISGGFSYPQLLPGFTYETIKKMENALDPFMRWIGIFQTIEVLKITS